MKTTIKCPVRFDDFVESMGENLNECIELALACNNLDIFITCLPYKHWDTEDFYKWAINQ